mmetsp:Transcript_24406/g.36612  ORF Transcript_24406/g.36612 Transcript_24406/m.36612 type:complete len:82 (-) Transcript_24406:78-323(-)
MEMLDVLYPKDEMYSREITCNKLKIQCSRSHFGSTLPLLVQLATTPMVHQSCVTQLCEKITKWVLIRTKLNNFDVHLWKCV